MIVKEYFMTRSDGIKLFRTYSDNELMIRQIETGDVYADAVDVEEADFTYEEIV